jgi:hypothetical protein
MLAVKKGLDDALWAPLGWTYTFLNRRFSTTSVTLPPLVIEPAARTAPPAQVLPCAEAGR